MKDRTFSELDENDDEAIHALHLLGLDRLTATLAVCLSQQTEPKLYRELEPMTDLSQSEVSKAVKRMRLAQWITEAPIGHNDRGRLLLGVTLVKPLEEIVTQLFEAKTTNVQAAYTEAMKLVRTSKNKRRA